VEESTRRNIELWAFPAGTFLGALFGLLVPAFGPPTRQYIVWLLVPLMVFSLARIKREEMREGLKRLDLPAVGLVFIYIIVPLVMWGSGLAARLPPDLLFGVTLSALSPAIALAPFFADMIGANRVLAAMISVVSTLLSPLLIPLMLVALVGRTVVVPVGSITFTAGVLVGLPVLIALVLRKARPSIRDNPLPGERIATSVIFFFFMWGVIAASLGGINLLSVSVLLGLALLQEYVFFFGLRRALGRLAERGHLSMGNAKALALCIGLKNGALAAGIALTFSDTVAISSGLITLISAPLFVAFGVFRERM
jgi:predicted Na+-dependent transporter